MKTAEKMIPKAALIRALHQILEAARNPEELAVKNNAKTAGRELALAFTVGWIEAIARDALGAAAATTGWLANIDFREAVSRYHMWDGRGFCALCGKDRCLTDDPVCSGVRSQ